MTDEQTNRIHGERMVWDSEMANQRKVTDFENHNEVDWSMSSVRGDSPHPDEPQASVAASARRVNWANAFFHPRESGVLARRAPDLAICTLATCHETGYFLFIPVQFQTKMHATIAMKSRHKGRR